jgi:predicted nucleic acid-binding protein
MCLVFDTNVLISAILAPDSLPANVLNWGEKNGAVLYLCSLMRSIKQQRQYSLRL